MASRGRSVSPRPVQDADIDMDKENGAVTREKPDAKVVIVTNLTRSVAESHLQTIFGFYGEITKIDLPIFGKSGQNRGKAALEYADPSSAHKAASHMDGGQLDGAILKVELSELPVRSRSRSRPRPPRNGRDRPRSLSRSRSRSRSPPPGPGYRRNRYEPRRGGGGVGRPYGRRAPLQRDTYRPRSRTRSRSPIRRAIDRLGPRRKSPSYERGGVGSGYRGRRSRSRSYSVRSSRSGTRSLSRSRSHSRSRSPTRSYSSYSRYSRSRSRTRSLSRGRRSYSRDDIRDSRSRSPKDM